MRFVKSITVAMLGFAFAAYGFDCSPMISPTQAMECCDSMNCSQGMHGEDCCQTGTSIHAPFVQVARTHGIAFAPPAFAVPTAPLDMISIDHADGRAVLRFHDPPLVFASTTPLQLRI